MARGGLLGAAESQLKEEGSDQKVQRPRATQLQDSWPGRAAPTRAAQSQAREPEIQGKPRSLSLERESSALPSSSRDCPEKESRLPTEVIKNTCSAM